MSDCIREVPTIIPHPVSGFAKPPTLYGTLKTFINMGNNTNGTTSQGEAIRRGTIRDINGNVVNESQLPKIRKVIRVIALKRYVTIKGHNNDNGLTIVTATDANLQPLDAIFVSAKLAEHRAISALCLGSADFVEFNTLDNPAKWLAVSAIDYDNLEGYEYYDGTNWQPLKGLNIQFAEEVEPEDDSAATKFEKAFGIKFDITNEAHQKMIERFL